jgi:ABC-2 type transport system permease protein
VIVSSTIGSAIKISEAERAQLRASVPSFFGIVRGELLKMSRRWSTWIPLIIVVFFLFATTMLQAVGHGLNDEITHNPLIFLYAITQDALGFVRAFTGLYFLILTAYVIGLEFQMGTIRVLVSRGVGKLTLLSAKVTSIAIVALLVLLGSLILEAILICAVLLIGAGNLNAFNSITSQFWSNTFIGIGIVLISAAVTILLGTFASVLGRSLTIGLCLGLAWFPADNIGSEFFRLGYLITQNNFWNNITGYFLGPNLNVMAQAILPANLEVRAILIAPLVTVSGSHTIWVAVVYGLIFAAASIFLTVKRDIKE